MKRVFLRGAEGEFENYMTALRAVGLEPVRSMALEAAASCDGLLLPGGADVDPARYGRENAGSVGIDHSRDRDELALIHRFLAAEQPILGICRGLQILNVALGGTLIQDLPDQRHRRDEQAKADRIHAVRVVHPLLQAHCGDRFVTNSAHHQAVERLADGLEPICISEDGVLEGFVHRSGKILAVQFHPERMAFALSRPDADDGAVIFRLFRRMLDG